MMVNLRDYRIYFYKYIIGLILLIIILFTFEMNIQNLIKENYQIKIFLLKECQTYFSIAFQFDYS